MIFLHVYTQLCPCFGEPCFTSGRCKNLTYAFFVIFPPARVHPLVFLGYGVRNAVRAVAIPLPKLPVTAINSSGAFPHLGAFTCLTNKRNDGDTIVFRVYGAPCTEAGLCLRFSLVSQIGCIVNLDQELPVWPLLNVLKSFQNCL